MSLEKNSSHFELVKSLASTVWFLDYDGSICPHLEVWEERSYDASEILLTLKNLRKNGAEVFWNTGRQVASLAGVTEDFLDFSGYFIHGSVFWDHQKKEERFLAPILEKAHVDSLVRLTEKNSIFRIEVKPTAIRIAPKTLNHMKELSEWVAITLDRQWPTPSEWTWHKGPRGWDLLHDHFNKGYALVDYYQKSQNSKIPVAVGDDDLDRYAVEESLRRGGFAILVGDNCGWITEVKHSPKKVLFFESPSELLEYLKQI